ncbi:hypothetical protein Busp01_49620 [Trinickia caryophylli]|nr:hypothetical protein Busp01_49620 [Trinickia caryophylli]
MGRKAFRAYMDSREENQRAINAAAEAFKPVRPEPKRAKEPAPAAFVPPDDGRSVSVRSWHDKSRTVRRAAERAEKYDAFAPPKDELAPMQAPPAKPPADSRSRGPGLSPTATQREITYQPPHGAPDQREPVFEKVVQQVASAERVLSQPVQALIGPRESLTVRSGTLDSGTLGFTAGDFVVPKPLKPSSSQRDPDVTYAKSVVAAPAEEKRYSIARVDHMEEFAQLSPRTRETARFESTVTIDTSRHLEQALPEHLQSTLSHELEVHARSDLENVAMARAGKLHNSHSGDGLLPTGATRQHAALGRGGLFHYKSLTNELANRAGDESGPIVNLFHEADIRQHKDKKT